MVINKEMLIPTLKNLPVVIETYLENIPSPLLDLKRNQDTWTIREHIYHIASVQQLLLERMLLIKNEADPHIVPFFPEKVQSRGSLYHSLTYAFADYHSFRDKQVELILSLSREEMQKTAKHPEYTEYSIPMIMNHMIFHEYWHMYRIEEIWLMKDEFFK